MARAWDVSYIPYEEQAFIFRLRIPNAAENGGALNAQMVQDHLRIQDQRNDESVGHDPSGGRGSGKTRHHRWLFRLCVNG